MNNIIPFKYKSKKIRVIQDDTGNPWWVAKDICDVLELSNPSEAIKMLDEDEKNTLRISEGINRGNPNVNVVNESGLYNLIIRSNKPEANKFRRWVTHDVIPSIRKTGSYTMSGKEPITLIPISKEFKAAVVMAKAAGFKGNQAALSANRAVFKITGYDCLDILDAKKLICEKQEIHLTASDLGKQLGNISAQQVNKFLETQGLIESYRDKKNRIHWKPTEKGKPYTILKIQAKSRVMAHQFND